VAALVASAALLAAATPFAAAKTGPPSGLSPVLTELAQPSVRDLSPAGQVRAAGLVPAGPGSLLRIGRRVAVYVRFDHGAVAALPAIRAAGGEVVDSSRRYQVVTVVAKPVDLHAIAAVGRVTSVTEVHAPFTAAAEECPSPGSVESEGVRQLNAGAGEEEARGKYGVDGNEVTVGVLSDSFDSATEAADGSGEEVATRAKKDEESGDLPGPNSPCSKEGEVEEPVDVIDEISPLLGEEAFDEGRGMAQIVHDVAPGAKIDFATAFFAPPPFGPGMFGFAKNIELLAEEGADVIADDVFYFEEPFFQDGPVAAAVDKVVEEGVAYFSAAGNDSLTDPEGHEIASWETPEYRDAGSCPPQVEALKGFNARHCLDFDPGKGVDKTFGIKVKPGRVLTIDLQWDEPWNGVETDLDAFLLNANGALREEAVVGNVETQEPTEILQWVNGSSSTQTMQLAINRFKGTSSPRVKFGLLENGSGVAATEYPKSTGEDVVGPTIFGHSGSASAVSVGAIPFDSDVAPEPYSSMGPVRHDFGPVEGIEEAERLEPAEILSKPDLVATDCGRTTFFADSEVVEEEKIFWRFCGTSAAAPHAAGVAALMLEKEPAAEPEKIRAALQEGARAVGKFGPCAVGAGMIDAAAAIGDLGPPSPSPSPGECLLPEPEGSVENAQAPGEWGLEAPSSSPPPSSPTTTTTERTARPRTFFRHRPSHLVRTRFRTARVVFSFGSNQTGATFACRIDTGLFRPCGERLARRFGLGRHTVRVFARGADGEGDPTPVAYHFRVKRAG